MSQINNRLNRIEKLFGGSCAYCAEMPKFRVVRNGKVDPNWERCPVCGRRQQFKAYMDFDPDEVTYGDP